MEHTREGDLILVRLDRGDDVVPSLLAALRAEKATGAVVLTALGAFEDVEFAYYDAGRKAYERRVEQESHEVLGVSGIVAPGPDGAQAPHFHITLAGRDHQAVGGHLFRARVSVLAEFALRAFDGPKVRREKEPAFGLNALRVR